VPGALNGDLTVTFDHQFITGNGRATRHGGNKVASQTGRSLSQDVSAIG